MGKETIAFDENGVCDACLFAEKKSRIIDWESRDTELRELCDKYRKDDGSYDCIVPGSGGKDSAMAAVLLKEKYGMHPLVVTWAPHIYTEVGFRNMQHCIHAGYDDLLLTPNGKVHRLLTRLAVQNLCHPFQPFIIGQKNLGAKMALKFNVPLVFYGENEAEYGNAIGTNDTSLRDDAFHSDAGMSVMDYRLGGVSVGDLMKDYGLELVDLMPYLPPKSGDLKALGVQVHYLGYYVRWDPQEAYYFCVENTGFECNPERTEGTYSKYHSLDDRIDGFHFFTTWIKFGIGRATHDTAQEIRNKKITREEGLKLIKKYDGEFPHKYFKEVLEYLDFTPDEFFDILDRNRSPHLWRFDKEENVWILKHTILGEEVVDDSRKKYTDPAYQYVSNKKMIDMPPLFD